MGHTKAQDLNDLHSELKEIRQLESLKEKSPGIFYYKSDGFLHFHDKDGKRWADVKIKGEWKELPIDFDTTGAQRAKFLSSVKKAHALIGGL